VPSADKSETHRHSESIATSAEPIGDSGSCDVAVAANGCLEEPQVTPRCAADTEVAQCIYAYGDNDVICQLTLWSVLLPPSCQAIIYNTFNSHLRLIRWRARP